MVRTWRTLLVWFAQVWLATSVGYKRRQAEAEASRAAEAVVPDAAADATKRLRGGHRQRQAAASCDIATSSTVPRALEQAQKEWFDALKIDWAKGKLSSQQVQDYALKSTRAGAHGVEMLGQAGNYGHNPSNVFRALRHAFGIPRGAPKDFGWIELPTVKGRKTPHAVIFPHLLPHIVYELNVSQ